MQCFQSRCPQRRSHFRSNVQEYDDVTARLQVVKMRTRRALAIEIPMRLRDALTSALSFSNFYFRLSILFRSHRKDHDCALVEYLQHLHPPSHIYFVSGLLRLTRPERHAERLCAPARGAHRRGGGMSHHLEERRGSQMLDTTGLGASLYELYRWGGCRGAADQQAPAHPPTLVRSETGTSPASRAIARHAHMRDLRPSRTHHAPR